MTQQQTVPEPTGPYLQVACLCENVVQRADGVLTLVNIVDRLTLTTQGTGAPETMPPTNYLFNLVLVFKSGRARGRYDLQIVPQFPDGSSKQPTIMSLNFEGEDDRGIQLVHQAMIQLTQEGLHWFNIYLAGSLVTRLPLRVVYARILGGLGPSTGRQGG